PPWDTKYTGNLVVMFGLSVGRKGAMETLYSYCSPGKRGQWASYHSDIRNNRLDVLMSSRAGSAGVDRWHAVESSRALAGLRRSPSRPRRDSRCLGKKWEPNI